MRNSNPEKAQRKSNHENDEQRIRELAYQMWGSEGPPEGRRGTLGRLAQQKLEANARDGRT